jgi:hypothetical protein
MPDSHSNSRRAKRPAPRSQVKRTRKSQPEILPEAVNSATGHHTLPAKRIQQARHPWLALGLILGFAACIVGGLWFVYSSGMVANRFKPDIEKELSKALNRPVTIERLEGGIFDRVVLKHVVIGAPASDPRSLEISIDRVVVRYSLWEIFVKKKALAEGLLEIQLIRPLIRFERDAQGVWHTPNLISWAGGDTPKISSIPPIKITLTQGEMRFSDPKQITSLQHVRGLLNLKDLTHAPLFLSGRTDAQRSQNIKISGELDLTRGQFRIGLTAEHLRLRPLERMAQFSPFFEILSGEASLSLRAVSRAKQSDDLIPGVDLHGKLVLDNCTLQTTLVSAPLRGMYGVTLWDNDRLTIKNLQAILGKTIWSAKGHIENFKRPNVFIKVQNDHLKLGDLVEPFPRLGQLKTTGEGSAVILIKGIMPDLIATATIRLANGKIGQMPIQNFESICRYAQGELRLLLARGTVAHGSAEGQGRILFSDNPQTSPTLDFSLTAKALALKDIGSLFKYPDVMGTADAQITVKGDLDHPTVRGEVSSVGIKWKQTEFKDFQSQFFFSPQAVNVTAKTHWGLMPEVMVALQLNQKGTGWLIQPFSISQNGAEILRAEGNYNLDSQKSIKLALTGKELPLALLPMWPPALTHLNGRFSIGGQCAGTLSNPYLQMHFSTPRLIRNAARAWEARGELRLTKDSVQIQTLEVDHKHLRLQGVLDFKTQDIQHSELVLERFPVDGVFALWGSSGDAPLHGKLQGMVRVSGLLKQLHSKGEISVQGLEGRGFSAQSGKMIFTTSGDNVWVKSLELIQSPGKFNAAIETNFAKNGYFRGRAWMDQFNLAGHRWDGDLKIDGAPKSPAAADYILGVALANLEMDDRSLPPLQGQCLWQIDKKNIQLRSLAWGNEVTVSGQISWEKKFLVQLQCLLNHSRLKSVREIINGNSKPLREAVTGLVRLQWMRQQLNTDFNLTLGTGELSGTGIYAATLPNSPPAYQVNLRLAGVPSRSLGDLFMMKKNTDLPEAKLFGNIFLRSAANSMPSTGGNLRCEDFHYGEWRFSKLNLLWESQGDRVELKQMEGLQSDGFLKSSGGTWQTHADGNSTFSLDLQAGNFNFLYKRFHGHIRLKGNIPTRDPFELNVNLTSPDFGLYNYTYGDLRADIHYKNEELSFQSVPGLPYRLIGHARISSDGLVDFKKLEIGDGFTFKRASATGIIDASGKGRSNFLVNVFAVPADVIARSFGWPQPWTGMARGSVLYTDPGNITNVKIKVKVEDGSVLNIPFDSFSGTVSIDHDWLYFSAPEDEAPPPEPALREGCILRRGDKYTMLLKGRLPVPQTPAAEKAMRGAEMDLKVVLPEGDLAYLAMVPYIASASGKNRFDLNIRGTMDYPALSGSAFIQDGTISPRFYTPRVDHVNAELKFDNNKTFIQRLDGRVGEGTLTIKAGPAAPWAMVFRRMIPDELNLVLDSSKGRLRLDSTQDFEFISAWMTGHVILGGTLDTPRLGGVMEVSDGDFTYPAKPLTPFAQAMKPVNVQCDNLKLITRKNFWFTNDMVRAQIKPDNSVIFRGGKNDFTGEGRVAIAKGLVTYMDANFSLDSSAETALTFQGREAPVLFARAQTTIRDVQIKDEGRMREVIIYLTVRGSLGSLKLELSSEPVMTQAQIMSLLTFGEDYSSWSKEQMDEKVQTAGARVLGRWAGSIIGQEIKKGLKKYAPVDVVDIHFGGVEKVAGSIAAGSGSTQTANNQGGTETTGMSLLQDTQIDLGKYLTDDLYLNYRATLKDRSVDRGGGLAWQSLLGLEYNLDSSRKLKVSKDFDADNGQEFYVGIEGRTEFKSWTPSEAESNTASGKAAPKKPGANVR